MGSRGRGSGAEKLSAERSHFQTTAEPTHAGRSLGAEHESGRFSGVGIQSRDAHNHATVAETLSARLSVPLVSAGQAHNGLGDAGAKHEVDRHGSVGPRSALLQDNGMFVDVF